MKIKANNNGKLNLWMRKEVEMDLGSQNKSRDKRRKIKIN